jgi:hypothetical protein
MLLIVLSAPLLVLLLPAGIIHLRHAWRLTAAWAGAVAAGAALEVTLLGGYGVPPISAGYSGPAVLEWTYLAESLGFLIVGASLMKIAASGHAADGPQTAAPVGDSP